MKNLKTKISGTIILFLLILSVSFVVFASNDEIQVIYSKDNEKAQYIIYIQDLINKDFKYALSTDANINEIDLNYINSVEDKEGNKVILINEKNYSESENLYLWVQEGKTQIISAKKLDLKDSFDKEKIEEVENITKKISTELTQIIEKDQEDVNGIKTTVTTGGLKITDTNNATYYYERTKLPKENYSKLMELAEMLNTKYSDMNMFDRIKFAKEFYNQYMDILKDVKWEKTENMIINQPNDTQENEQYVIFLKKVDENGKEVTDVKFLTSYRKDVQDKTPEKTETIVTQETAKLPITYDSLVLIMIFAVILVTLIFVVIKIKSLSKNMKEK